MKFKIVICSILVLAICYCIFKKNDIKLDGAIIIAAGVAVGSLDLSMA